MLSSPLIFLIISIHDIESTIYDFMIDISCRAVVEVVIAVTLAVAITPAEGEAEEVGVM